MISSIKIENYKCLNFSESMILKRLTLLSGINNTGKSSLIKGLLDISLHTENNNRIDSLKPSVIPLFSNFKSLVLNHETANKISFNFEIEQHDIKIKINLSFKYSPKAQSGYISSYHQETYNKKRELITSLYLTKNKVTDLYTVRAKKSLLPLFGQMKKDMELPEYFEGKGEFVFLGYIPIQATFAFKNNHSLNQWFEKQDDNEIIFSIRGSNEIFNTITSIKYIGPLRSSPKEYYFMERRGVDIDSRGDNTIEVLDRLKDKEIKFYKTISDKKLSKMKLLDAVKYWYKYFHNEAEFSLKEVSENLKQVLISGHPINHSGFGFSQLLPIIVQSLLLKEEDILLLEQPELHLHPSLEMKLANFLLCIAKNNSQIIAETHSEHLINALILIRMDFPSMENDMQIIFFSKNNNKSKFEEINVSARGEIKNWPVGFFDQYVQFTKEVIQRRKVLAENKLEK